MYVPDAETAGEWIKAGVTFFELASEVDLIAQGSLRLVEEFRSTSRTMPSAV
jgi:2-keto-3-deoxy-L-rhamnonate aldolase RhmA